MGTHVELAMKKLFDKDALAVSNIKLYPGTSRETTAEQFAEQINNAISQIEAGDFEVVDLEKCDQ
jgi:hypothetical protein